MSRFVLDESDVREHQCMVCRHVRDGGTCDAFPAGIPSEIRLKERDHRQPYPGDQGVRFEAKPGRRHPLDVIADGRAALTQQQGLAK